MVATPSGGEFNRLDRAGDYMEGNLQIIEISQPKGSFLEFLSAEFGVIAGGVRQNGNDLEFYDLTVGAWVKLSSLTGHLGDIYYVQPTPGQFVFNLPFTYVVGSNTLQVEVVGVSRVPGPGAPTPIYAETSGTQVTFLNGPAGIAPWTPFVGTELLIFFVPGRPNVNDTFTVKGDAADASPNYLDTKITATGAAVATSPGSPANTLRNIDVPFATAIPPASAGAGAVGVSANVAREDHQHPDPALGSYLYDEETNGAGFTAGVGPNHVITLQGGKTYPMGQQALLVMHNGVQIPYSKLTELTTSTYQINGLGPLLATDLIVTRIPKGAAPSATYVPGTPGDWAAPPPGTVTQALDRLAAALAAHLGAPIP